MRCLAALLILAGALTGQTPKPNGVIKGTVRDATGAPVSGVSVGTAIVITNIDANSVGYSPSLSTQTDEDGTYLLPLAPGTYSLRVERDRATVVTRQTKLEAGQEVTLDFVIPASLSISGRVLDQDKEPVVDAFVWLLKAEYNGGSLKQTVSGPKVTDSQGAYAFDTGLEANRRYLLLVDFSPPDEVASAAAADLKDRHPIQIPTWFPSAVKMESASPVVLQPGERREQVDIKVATSPFYCVAGKIQVSGKPAPSDFTMQTSALAGTRLVRLRGSAADDGTFHACGLPPGAYRLATGEGAVDFTVLDSDVDSVHLSADPAHLRLEVDWDIPPPPLQISSLDADSISLLRKIASAMGNQAPTDEDLQKLAVRTTSGVTPDAEMVKAIGQIPDFVKGFGHLMGQVADRRDLLNVTLSSAATGADVGFPGRIPYQGPIKESIPAGDYTLDIRPLGQNSSYVKDVYYDGLKLPDRTVHVAPEAHGTVRVVMSRDGAVLTVIANDTEGKPVPDATVLLIPDSVTSAATLARDLQHGQADQGGSFHFQALPPGRYRVLATTQSIRWTAPEDLEKMLQVVFQGKGVELESKGDSQVTVVPVLIY